VAGLQPDLAAVASLKTPLVELGELKRPLEDVAGLREPMTRLATLALLLDHPILLGFLLVAGLGLWGAVTFLAVRLGILSVAGALKGA
jgi:hypothetical protein